MRALVLLLVASLLAGCAASGASTSNFELAPARVGWFAGEEASFTLSITKSFLRSEPVFEIDRRFAIEEILLNERGMRVGGDHATREPDDVQLRLLRDGVEQESWTLDTSAPELEVRLVLPDSLKDSEYQLELRVFEVGWVKSEPFRVDRR